MGGCWGSLGLHGLAQPHSHPSNQRIHDVQRRGSRPNSPPGPPVRCQAQTDALRWGEEAEACAQCWADLILMGEGGKEKEKEKKGRQRQEDIDEKSLC